MSNKKVASSVYKVIKLAEANQKYDTEKEELTTIAKKLQHLGPASLSGAEHIATVLKETLLEINEMKERNNERRHKEILALIEKLLKPQEPTQVLNKSTDKSLNVTAADELETFEEYLDDEMDCEDGQVEIIERIQLAQIPTKVPVRTHPINPSKVPPKNPEKGKLEYELVKKQIIEMQKRKMEERLKKSQCKRKALKKEPI